jgi:hypothetical protein
MAAPQASLPNTKSTKTAKGTKALSEVKPRFVGFACFVLFV